MVVRINFHNKVIPINPVKIDYSIRAVLGGEDHVNQGQVLFGQGLVKVHPNEVDKVGLGHIEGLNPVAQTSPQAENLFNLNHSIDLLVDVIHRDVGFTRFSIEIKRQENVPANPIGSFPVEFWPWFVKFYVKVGIGEVLLADSVFLQHRWFGRWFETANKVEKLDIYTPQETVI